MSLNFASGKPGSSVLPREGTKFMIHLKSFNCKCMKSNLKFVENEYIVHVQVYILRRQPGNYPGIQKISGFTSNYLLHKNYFVMITFIYKVYTYYK